MSIDLEGDIFFYVCYIPGTESVSATRVYLVCICMVSLLLIGALRSTKQLEILPTIQTGPVNGGDHDHRFLPFILPCQ